MMKTAFFLIFLSFNNGLFAQSAASDSIDVMQNIEFTRKQIEALRKESEILQRIHKSYIEQVDSLANLCLSEGKADLSDLNQYLAELNAMKSAELEINKQLRETMKDLVRVIDRLNHLLTEE